MFLFGKPVAERSSDTIQVRRAMAIGMHQAPCWAECAAIGVIGVDVLLASRQNEYSGVVQPWRRGCPPSRCLLGTCWSPFAKARTSPFTAADSTQPIARPTPRVPQSEESENQLMLFLRF